MFQIANTTIKDQIEDLRELYDTPNIFNKCSKKVLTIEEMKTITYVLKEVKHDGLVEVSKYLELFLSNGRATILDAYHV